VYALPWKEFETLHCSQVLEEEAAKAARLAELKAKAEQLRQEKSYLFGLLKQVSSVCVRYGKYAFFRPTFSWTSDHGTRR
jgi:hypothetical protein